jgi:hypothetical protein
VMFMFGRLLAPRDAPPQSRRPAPIPAAEWYMTGVRTGA